MSDMEDIFPIPRYMTEPTDDPEELAARKEIRQYHPFPGTNPNVTAVEVLAAIKRALAAIEAGDYKLISDLDNPPLSGRRPCRLDEADDL